MGQGKFDNAVTTYSYKEVVTKVDEPGTVGRGMCYLKRKRVLSANRRPMPVPQSGRIQEKFARIGANLHLVSTSRLRNRFDQPTL